jgi:hypothetical protein
VAEEGRRHAAKCSGEALAAGEPEMSEWGNPPGVHTPAPWGNLRRAPGELKHLSTPRRRKDSPSSGERTGRSPNRGGDRSLPALPFRGWTQSGEEAAASSRAHNFALQPKAAGTGRWKG